MGARIDVEARDEGVLIAQVSCKENHASDHLHLKNGTDKKFREARAALFVLELHGFLTVKAARPWSGAEGHL